MVWTRPFEWWCAPCRPYGQSLRYGRWPQPNIECFLGVRAGRSSDVPWARHFRPFALSLPGPARLLPKLARDSDRIDAGTVPPRWFVTGAMDCAVMNPAEWHGEFIARFAAESTRLHVTEMMRVRWLAAADEAGLLHDVVEVLAPRSPHGSAL
jgi:hypothetical protein